MKVKRVSNIPNIKDKNGNWLVDYYPCPYERHTTRSGLLWGNIQIRCKEGGAHQERRPTYIGCKNSFKSFQSFVDWTEAQYGIYTKEIKSGQYWALDKDISCIGNMEYSEQHCLFVPKELNVLFPKRKVKPNGLPIGVAHIERKFKKSLSYIGKGFQQTKAFATKEEAHKYWQESKILAIHCQMKSGQIVNHVKLLEALDYRVQVLKDDILNNRETKNF